jgi:hypothetical protein
MRDVDPLFPRSFRGRLQHGAQSILFLCVAIYGVFHWPPVGIVARGIWTDLFLALIFEMMVATLPMGLLGLWWAIATPEWIRTLSNRVFEHVGIVLLALVDLGLCGMVAGALGWW